MNEDMLKLAEDYAEIAQNLLEEQGEEYTEEDIVKVANFLIDQDYPSDETDEYTELAQDAFLDGFNDEMQKSASRFVRDPLGLPGEGRTILETPMEMAGAAISERLSPVTRYRPGKTLRSARYRNPGRIATATAILAGLGILGAGAGAGYYMNKQSSFNKHAAKHVRYPGDLPGEGVTILETPAEIAGAAIQERIRPVTRYKPGRRGAAATGYWHPAKVTRNTAILAALGLLGAGAGAGYLAGNM